MVENLPGEPATHEARDNIDEGKPFYHRNLAQERSNEKSGPAKARVTATLLSGMSDFLKRITILLRVIVHKVIESTRP